MQTKDHNMNETWEWLKTLDPNFEFLLAMPFMSATNYAADETDDKML